MTTAQHVLVLFDGLCEPLNPGGTGCFGYTIRGLTGPVDAIAGSGALPPLTDGQMTNNYAEYAALGRAVALIVANYRDRITPQTQLVICGDSKLVIEQLAGRWKCEAPHLVKLRDAVKEKLAYLGCQWRAEWIPREQNVEADFLSRAAYTGRTGQLVPECPKKGAAE